MNYFIPLLSNSCIQLRLALFFSKPLTKVPTKSVGFAICAQESGKSLTLLVQIPRNIPKTSHSAKWLVNLIWAIHSPYCPDRGTDGTPTDVQVGATTYVICRSLQVPLVSLLDSKCAFGRCSVVGGEMDEDDVKKLSRKQRNKKNPRI